MNSAPTDATEPDRTSSKRKRCVRRAKAIAEAKAALNRATS